MGSRAFKAGSEDPDARAPVRRTTRAPRTGRPEPGATPVQLWVTHPPPHEVRQCIDRLARLDDARHIAVMPDVHLSGKVCVGTVIATSDLLYPEAIGGDIGCGYSGIALDAPAEALRRSWLAERLFDHLHLAAPFMRHPSLAASPPLPASMTDAASRLIASALRRDGRIELGTLGRGNHFLEFQADEDGRLWVMVHSGSRALGQAASAAHTPATSSSGGIGALEAASDRGRAFLHDHELARAFARENRRLLLDAACAAVARELEAPPVESTRYDTDHNHVARERHGGVDLWVHRKGANRAAEGGFNAVPGSMGTRTFHVRGRGETRALESSSHGAGRRLSRTEARRRISARELHEQLGGVIVEPGLRSRLMEEAPGAYKDVDAVMRAQRDLVKIVRRLSPVLVYKAG